MKAAQGCTSITESVCRRLAGIRGWEECFQRRGSPEKPGCSYQMPQRLSPCRELSMGCIQQSHGASFPPRFQRMGPQAKPQAQDLRRTMGTWSKSAAAKLLQSCPTLCNPIESSPPGSPVPGILQARTLEWVALSFSNAWKWKVKVKLLSRVRLLETPWTAAHQAPPSMGFSRQEYWSGMPVPSLI